jgi:F-type H+-transporting ATPase subunit b
MDKIAQAEADAVRQVRAMAVDLAIAATRQVIAEELTGKRADALVDQSIAELPQKLH